MIDKTTAGVTAEPEEVEAILRNVCGYHLAERDPVFRYTVLTREQVLYDALTAAIKRERGRALAELVASGTTLTHAAQLTNLTSRQQVTRLIALAKAAEPPAPEVETASREFEDRLAAVEATLDEVVSGIAPPAPTEAPAAEIPAPREPTHDIIASDTAPASPTTVLGEATHAVPVLATVIHPAKEIQSSDDTRWWRRNRDTGAA
jgi:hypothetical protein